VSLSVTVAIMTVPSRVEARLALMACVSGLDPDPLVVEDTEAEGDVWRQYQRCLTGGRPSSHRLVLQDDALPVEGFSEAALGLLERKPDRVVCFYVPALPTYFGQAMMLARSRGATWTELRTRGMFCPVVATAWPMRLAEECAFWKRHSAYRSGPAGRADDARVADWLRGTKRLAIASVPCLVDHDETVASALNNGGRYSRRAAILPDTPLGELTIA
jgi:hypothetical protein